MRLPATSLLRVGVNSSTLLCTAMLVAARWRVDPSHSRDMDDTGTVDRRARTALRVVSVKYPLDRIKLLEAVQVQRGDEFVSRTVAHALDRLIEEHFPGCTTPEAA